MLTRSHPSSESLRDAGTCGLAAIHQHRLITLERCVTRSPWRIGVPFQALERCGVRTHIIGNTIAVNDFHETDLLVLHNPATANHVALVHAARERGASVVVDVDDLLLPEHLPVQTEFGRWWHPERHRWEADAQADAGIETAPGNAVFQHLQESVRAANALTVTTATLADLYRELHTNIHILPNCYDDTNPLWDVIPPQRSTINIGFLGTEHHGPNLDLIHGALEPVLQRHPEARIVEAGEGDLFTRIQAPAERFIHLGWLPFAVFPLVLHQMDIVLAPLVDELFMRSKSNIRCMTAGLVGAPVVASPVGPYADYVEHGVNGFLAAETAEWTHYLERLVADPRLRQQMGEANRQRARDYALSTNIDRWSNLYAALLNRHCCA